MGGPWPMNAAICSRPSAVWRSGYARLTRPLQETNNQVARAHWLAIYRSVWGCYSCYIDLECGRGATLFQQLLQEGQFQWYVTKNCVCTAGSTPGGEDRPLKSIEASRRRWSSPRNNIYHTLWKVWRLPSRGQRCSAHSSGWGCQIVLFAWERRSRLRWMGHRAAVSSRDSSANQCWFLRSGATNRTLCFCSLIRLITCGIRAIVGKA